jgi:transcriptional antiterminator
MKKREIDWELFEKLVWVPVLATHHLADMLKVSKKTLERHVKQKYGLTIDAVREQKSGPMRHTLFSSMWNAATVQGNISAMIWMSKNVLGWSDKVEQKTEVKAEQEIVYTAEWGGTTETPSPQAQEPSE